MGITVELTRASHHEPKNQQTYLRKKLTQFLFTTSHPLRHYYRPLNHKSNTFRAKRCVKLQCNNSLFNERPLGIVVGKQSYVNANSQWEAIDNSGHIPDPEKLNEPIVLKTPIVER